MDNYTPRMLIVMRTRMYHFFSRWFMIGMKQSHDINTTRPFYRKNEPAQRTVVASSSRWSCTCDYPVSVNFNVRGSACYKLRGVEEVGRSKAKPSVKI
jgi:hypothetical protein